MVCARPADPSVYLLWCGPQRALYCGWTTDVERRLAAHRAGRGAKYTRAHPPVELAAVIRMTSASAARREEARIKRMSRADKLALVARHLPANAVSDRAGRATSAR